MARKRRKEKQSLEELVDVLIDRYHGSLLPPLEGLAYRFTIYLPVLAEGQPVFSDLQRTYLFDLFRACCGGYTQSSLQGFPPWHGSWFPEGAEDPVVDHHVLLVIYALQDAKAEVFFRQVKWMLEQDHVAGQEVVLIEQIPVRLIEAMEIA